MLIPHVLKPRSMEYNGGGVDLQSGPPQQMILHAKQMVLQLFNKFFKDGLYILKNLLKISYPN